MREMNTFYLALAALLTTLCGPAFSKDLLHSKLEETQARLDPVSAKILGDNQEKWLERQAAIHVRISSFVKAGEISNKEAKEIRNALVSQRVEFLSTLSPNISSTLTGAWTDGFRELLIDIPEVSSGRPVRGKVASFAKDLDGKRIQCVIHGTIIKRDDGIALTPDETSDRAIRIRRKGIALSIEDEEGDRSSNAQPLCSEEDSLIGQYFYIDGSILLIPFLMR